MCPGCGKHNYGNVKNCYDCGEDLRSTGQPVYHYPAEPPGFPSAPEHQHQHRPHGGTTPKRASKNKVWVGITIGIVTIIIIGAIVGVIMLKSESDDSSSGSATTWSSDKTLTDEYIVEEVEILVIEPGVTVELTGYEFLHVYGTLIAKGTESRPITFKPVPEDVNTASVLIIFQNNSADERSILSHCHLEDTPILMKNHFLDPPHLSRPLRANSTPKSGPKKDGHVCISYMMKNTVDLTITNCDIISTRNYTGGQALTCFDGSSPTISYNTITNYFCGIYCQNGSDALITHNTIRDNHNTGISVNDHSNATITYNRIDKHKTSINCWRSCPTINNNSITNSSRRAIETMGDCGLIDAEYNYWGTTDKTKLYRLMQGNIDYEPMLEGPPKGLSENPLYQQFK